MRENPATVVRIVDGDTLRVTVDLGFDLHLDATIRLLGIDTPERFTERGKKATAFVRERIDTGSKVFLRSFKRGKYGRWLGDVFYEADGILKSLVEDLRINGFEKNESEKKRAGR